MLVILTLLLIQGSYYTQVWIFNFNICPPRRRESLQNELTFGKSDE